MFNSAPELCSALSAVGNPPCAPFMPASSLKYLGFLKRFHLNFVFIFLENSNNSHNSIRGIILCS